MALLPAGALLPPLPWVLSCGIDLRDEAAEEAKSAEGCLASRCPASKLSCVLSRSGVTPSSPEKLLSDALMILGGVEPRMRSGDFFVLAESSGSQHDGMTSSLSS